MDERAHEGERRIGDTQPMGRHLDRWDRCSGCGRDGGQRLVKLGLGRSPAVVLMLSDGFKDGSRNARAQG